ncbi:hypothetical protein [Paenibacillus hubeiensis]|uniref:DUF5983 family protein n=1 Tax=Paenibacillus hubeiensis TaxID=3077330 RepID=UPI0031BAF21B
MTKVLLVAMFEEILDHVQLFEGKDAIPKVLNAFHEWTGVQYHDYARRRWTTKESSFDILGEDYVGSEIIFLNGPKMLPTGDPMRESFITVSTAHISEDVNHQLQNEWINKTHQLIYYAYEYGYFICILDEPLPEEETLPDSLRQVVLFARSKGAQWLKLDRDGDIFPELPTFNW